MSTAPAAISPHVRHPAVIIHLIVTALLLAVAVATLPLVDRYGDIVTETLTLDGLAKIPDLYAWAVVLLAVPLQFFFYGVLHRAIIRAHRPVLPVIRTVLWITLIPPALALAPLLLPASPPAIAGTGVVLALAFLPLFLGALAMRRKRIDARFLRFAAFAQPVGAILAMCSGCGLGLALVHLGIADVYTAPLIGILCVAGGLALWLAAWFMIVSRGSAIALHRALGTCAVATPLLWLQFLPAPLFHAGRKEVIGGPGTTPVWSLLVALLLLASLVSVVAISSKRSGTIFNHVAPLRPLVRRPLLVLLLPIAAFMTFGAQPAPFLTEDWFHPAQFWLPAQQLFNFGAIPYVDQHADQGLAGIWPAFLNLLVSGGAPSLFLFSHQVLQALLTVVIVIIAGRSWGFVPAILLALMPAVEYKTQMMLLMAIALSAPGLWRKPLVWLGAWLPLAVVTLTYVPMPGMAAALGSLPFAVWQFLRAGRKAQVLFGGACTVCAAAILLTPARDFAFGYLSFILDQAATNTIALGIPLANPAGPPPAAALPAGHVLFNLVRFAWIPVLALLFMFWFWRSERIAAPGRRSILPYHALGGLTFLFFSFYAVYRIESNELSRTWIVSVLALGSLLLVVLCRRPSWQQPHVFLTFWLTFALVINAGATLPWLSPEYLSARVGPRVVPLAYSATADAERFPTIAGLYARPHVVEHIETFDRILRSGLPPRYYDFTDGPLRSYIQNQPVPAPYALWYNAHNEHQQRDLIDALEREDIAFILAGPILYPGDYTPALRCYRLYRWALDRFRAVKIREFTLLVRNDLATPPSDDAARAAEVEILTPIFAMENWRHLPELWGRSWDALANRFEAVETASVAPGNNGPIVHALSATAERPDFLLIEGQLPLGAKEGISLQWRDEWGAAPPVKMSATNDRLLLPLGTLPRWLRARRIESISIEGIVQPVNLTYLTLRRGRQSSSGRALMTTP